MYIQFFNLRQGPFSIAPDPHYLYMSERHREALAHLLYGIRSGGGFVLLTGEIGAGKTTICRCLIEQIPDNCNLAYIFNPRLSVDELLQSICHEFGIVPADSAHGAPSVRDYVQALNAFLLRTHAAGRHSVLIIDEAQNLDPDVLEQLRLLTNLETNECKLLQIILIGQPELRQMLELPELEQLAQRVIARYHLQALSRQETSAYIQHRLAVAGLHDSGLFKPRALQLIHHYSKGIPRRINLLCDRALLGAYARGHHVIDGATIKQAAREVFGPRHLRGRRWRGAALGLGAGAALAGVALAAVALTVVAGGQLPWLYAPQAKAAPGAAAAVAAVQPVQAAPAVAALPQAGSWQELAQLDEEGVFRELARLWQVSLPAGDACQMAGIQGLRCYRGNGGLEELRRLDRPAILKLRDDTQRIRHVLLIGLDAQQATLRMANHDQPMSLSSLERIFTGEFATFWRSQPEFREQLQLGDQGADVDWLNMQMARFHATAAAPGGRAFDDALTRQLQQFQRAQGLTADGRVGPRTVMLINQAVGIDEPRLKTAGGGANATSAASAMNVNSAGGVNSASARK